MNTGQRLCKTPSWGALQALHLGKRGAGWDLLLTVAILFAAVGQWRAGLESVEFRDPCLGYIATRLEATLT